MTTGIAYRCSSVLAALTVAVSVAFFIPYMAGASTFEGSSGYVSALLLLPTLLVVSLAMRAWGRRLRPGTSSYRATLVIYGLLSFPAIFAIFTLLF